MIPFRCKYFWMLAAGLTLLIGLGASPSFAETTMVKDIYPGSGSSEPEYLAEYNGQVFFRANDGTYGDELWVTDGTTAGTTILVDINPGGSSSPYGFIHYNGQLFFGANDGTYGNELWVTDGTAAGTYMVADIYPGSVSSSPYWFAEYNGKLFFSAQDANGRELWVTDGTAEGTYMVADIYPGGSSDPRYLTELNGQLFFWADNGTNGRELWVTDGTQAGTQMAVDIISGSGSSYPEYLTAYNGQLFFRATDGPNNYELWVSDGTAEGTYMLVEINPGGNSFPGSWPNGFSEYNGQLFFGADNGTNGHELWVSDGTAEGTYMVADIYPGGSSSEPDYLTEYNGKLFFSARDANGDEVWATDGTAEGTYRVADIYPGGSSEPTYLTELNGQLFFGADNGTNGHELWAMQPQPDNEPPVVSDASADPNPAAVGTDMILTATVDDFGMGDSTVASAEYSLDGDNWVAMDALDGDFDEMAEEVFAPIAAFVEAGVHDVCIRGMDSAGNQSAGDCLFLVAYDPEGGFVTGGGWIWSPEGACQLDSCDESTTGKANFGFVAKYKHGATTPTGETEFQFKAGDLNFHSDSYDWLVVAGAKAMYKGVGTINGAGNYGFMLSAIDADINDNDGFDKDRFRIKIWDKDDGDFVVYDNQMGAADDEDPATEIGGGSIIIHQD